MKYVDVNRDVSCFQQGLSGQQISSLCEHAFGYSPDPGNCQLLTSGKFNTSYKITHPGRLPVVLRVAPPVQAIIFKHEQYLLRRESSIQQVLNTVSGKIPRNLFVDFSRGHIARDYVFQNYLPGTLWDDIKTGLSDEENEQLWCQLGGIVNKIHSIPGANFGPPDPVQQFGSWSDAMIALISNMLTDMQEFHLPCKDAAEFLQIVKSGRWHLDKVTQPRLVHGDLWQKNILIGRYNGFVEITAVLDAERAFWGDSEAEWIFSFLDIPEAFWQSYGKLQIDRSALFRRLVYTGRGAMQLCLEACRFRFDDLSFRRTLQRTIEKLSTFDAWMAKTGT